MVSAILDSVINTAEKNDAIEVLEVVVEIGELSMLNPEQVSFLIDVLKKDTIAENADFKLIEIPLKIKCPKCDYEGKADVEGDHYAAIYKCPDCGEMRVEVTEGRDCIVRNIKVDLPDD